MLARLMDQLESPRRHLAFLVGLLVLTFVFAGLLAREAQRAEVSRRDTARGVLQDMVASASRDWATTLQEFTFNALAASMMEPGELLLQNPDLPLSEVRSDAVPSHFCVDCTMGIGRIQFLDLGLEPAERPATIPAALHQLILNHMASDSMPRMHARLAGALYAGHDQGGEPVALAAYAIFDADRQPVRLIGFEVPIAVMSEMIHRSFSALEIVQPTLANGLPNDAFFVPSAHFGSLPMLAGHVQAEFSAEKTLAQASPLPGLMLEVGVRPDAERLLVIGGASTGRLTLLLGLLTTIAGLIVLALLLVRREVELVRLRADFISGVSHELRTPLAQIRMFTETLLLGRVRSDVERRRSLEIIDQEARRLTHLVENVLLFSKAEGGRHTRLAPETTSFAAEIRRAVESFSPMGRSRDVEIRTELQENITAQVDRCALRQILVNLVENALKYGPASQRITVGVALFEDVARVWVDDEGPGIPAGERERVFESFHRLRRDIDQRTAGSGIGLAVVRELATLHGGQSWAEDAPGGGARVVVQFPGAYLRAESAPDLAAAS